VNFSILDRDMPSFCTVPDQLAGDATNLVNVRVECYDGKSKTGKKAGFA